jgi:hypothetical protein
VSGHSVIESGRNRRCGRTVAIANHLS